MLITDLSLQVHNQDRVNVFIDGAYTFSLDITQVTDLGIKKGQEIDNVRLAELQGESEFGKLYARGLEYCLSRPHSVREVHDYLQRKTHEQRYKSRRTGEVKIRPGVSQSVANRVLAKLQEKGYVNDEHFARWWIEHRNYTKGISMRKLANELRAKGVSSTVIDEQLTATERTDDDELRKLIAKKASKYDDQQKFTQYLIRQGFSYDDVKTALANDSN